MEHVVSFGFSDMGRTVRKKRSNPYRRPPDDSQFFPVYHGNSSLSFTLPSDNGRKELNLNQSSSRASNMNLSGAETALKISDEDRGFGDSNVYGIKSISEPLYAGMDAKKYNKDVLASSVNWKSTSKVKEGLELQSRSRDTHINEMISCSHSSGKLGVASDGQGSENKLKKVKLKLGGVTRTIHSKSTSDGASMGESSSISRSSDAPITQQNLDVQYNSDDHFPSPDKGSGLRGVPWKDFSRTGFSTRKVASLRRKITEENVYVKQSEKYEPVRKSNRAPKRRLLDGNHSYGDDDNDGEICYLEKLKTAKVAHRFSAEYEDQGEDGSKKHRKISRVLYQVGARDYGSLKSVKESKKSRSETVSEDTDYVEDEEPLSDGEPESRRKKQKKEFVELLGDTKKEMAITTRQRALHTGKDISSGSGASVIEFPKGLPPAPPRQQKEKLSEVEQQLKKAEAAQRRRMQMEKAARESEAEAIRKILGQDSSRKKREDKIKKRQEELAQERAISATTLASNTVRWVMCPTGTVVTFPDDMGLPSILQPKHCSYPPPREKCAGPFCTNPYKYRDSKLKLPLCSLQCYKAVYEKMQPMTAC